MRRWINLSINTPNGNDTYLSFQLVTHRVNGTAKPSHRCKLCVKNHHVEGYGNVLLSQVTLINIGRRTSQPVLEAIADYRGSNDISPSVRVLDSERAKIEGLELLSTGIYSLSLCQWSYSPYRLAFYKQ